LYEHTQVVFPVSCFLFFNFPPQLPLCPSPIIPGQPYHTQVVALVVSFFFLIFFFTSQLPTPPSFSLPPPPYIWMAIPRSPVPTTLLFLYIAVSDPGHFFSIQGCIYRLFPFPYLLSQQNNVPFNAGWEML
jgi:hypothetical protein